MAPKKKVLSIKDKMEIINVVEREKLSVREIAKRFDIGKSQAAEIKKNKETIRSKWESGVNVLQKRSFKKEGGSEIDKICFDWFTKAKSQSIPVSGPIVKQKAKEVAHKLGVSNFVASDGWLNKWRIRNNVAFKSISGKASNVNPIDVEQFKEKLPSLLRDYKPEDIYNADESGLFFRALPDKTIALKSEKCIGGKLCKERLTILFCTNMAGQKELLLVIGKAAIPRAFKHLSLNELPVDWKSNKTAWMTREIMTAWLTQLNRKMRFQNRNIILFLDNAASHQIQISFTNIKLIFLPPITTAACQPLDQGIIQNFKVFYRSSILQHLLPKIDSAVSASELAKSINILEALYFIKTSWDKVKATTFKNCFLKAGFPETNQCVSDFDIGNDICLSTYRSFKNGLPVLNNFDDFLKTNEVVFTEDNSIEIQVESELADIRESDDEVIEEIAEPIGSYKDALEHLALLKHFAREDFKGFNLLKNVETHFEAQHFKLNQSKLKQSPIIKFFQPNLTDNYN
nr:tigger transposable element-derived protein 6 [Bactrocera oleae]XP_014095331.1 tigger transposable element-derived protein 6 [Bactrocera oleae]XP_014095339.1 tigger transposable element-derived protein 6 [Bactrocera oleae]XP_014095347.1 tigger transposable element-derived protein 6 [Bactrocera oleae]